VDNSRINVFSLCSGIGGLELGIKLAMGDRCRVIGYCERDSYAASVIMARMEDETLDKAPIYLGDIRGIDGRPWRSLVDIITGGYPCQPFSTAGNRLGKRDNRHIWPELSRLVKEIYPSIVFFENVAGHISLGFNEVYDELSRLGYRVKAGIFSASEVYASHNRERLFILGYKKKAMEYSDNGNVEGSEKYKTDDAENSRFTGYGTRIYDAAHTNKSSKNAFKKLFPPGPEEHKKWEQTIKGNPSIKPAIYGMVNGAPGRMERLAVIGNGVVPIVAAKAFISLIGDIFYDIDGEEAE
jgi:DNA (cytosine-5)-methyltransferase 1